MFLDVLVVLSSRNVQGTWAFMSIAALLGDDFKHILKDDMESFFYVILYASILWLPHREVNNIKRRMSKFFDEYDLVKGKAEGGASKYTNRALGNFVHSWGFKNQTLGDWFGEVLELQRPVGEEINWTPEALYDVWTSIDERGLPNDDRSDNLVPKLSKGRPKPSKDQAQQDTYTPNPVEQKTILEGECDSPSEKRRASSKRSAEDAELIGRTADLNKRLCNARCLVVES